MVLSRSSLTTATRKRFPTRRLGNHGSEERLSQSRIQQRPPVSSNQSSSICPIFNDRAYESAANTRVMRGGFDLSLKMTPLGCRTKFLAASMAIADRAMVWCAYCAWTYVQYHPKLQNDVSIRKACLDTTKILREGTDTQSVICVCTQSIMLKLNRGNSMLVFNCGVTFPSFAALVSSRRRCN